MRTARAARPRLVVVSGATRTVVRAPRCGWSRAGTPEEVARAVQALQRWLPDRGAEELRRGFVAWVRQIAGRPLPAGATLPLVRTLEESMTLVERVVTA